MLIPLCWSKTLFSIKFQHFLSVSLLRPTAGNHEKIRRAYTNKIEIVLASKSGPQLDPLKEREHTLALLSLYELWQEQLYSKERTSFSVELLGKYLKVAGEPPSRPRSWACWPARSSVSPAWRWRRRSAGPGRAGSRWPGLSSCRPAADPCKNQQVLG